jgi:uncharacterized protein (TIGR03437 family)
LVPVNALITTPNAVLRNGEASPAGGIYVADSFSNRVRLLTASGSPCTYSVSAAPISAAFSAGSVSATIQTGDSCTWAIQNLPDWITITGSNVGSASADVSLSIAANNGPARAAQISIAGVSIEVSQLSGELTVGAGGVANAASYTLPVAPGSISAIFGNFLLNSPFATSSLPLSTSLGSLSLQFGPVLTPLFYASGGQVNGQVPWELSEQTEATITASINGQTSAPQTVPLSTYAPGIFSLDGSGTGAGAILDSNYKVISTTNPTTAGAYIQIYCTGLGPVTNQPATGAGAPGSPPAETTTPATVWIGGIAANVLFAGLTPGTVGLYQVNVQVPAGVSVGNVVSVEVSIGSAQSNVVTVAIQ